MRVWVLIASIAVTAVVLSCGTASAAGPVRFPAGPVGPFDYAAGQFCAFPVHEQTVANNETVKLFFDADFNLARVMVNGRLVVRYTNRASGRHVTLNASGPATTYLNPDGSGRTVARGITTDVMTDSGPVVAYGKAVTPFTVNRTLPTRITGRSVSICGLLG